MERGKAWQSVAAAWIASLGFDLLLHAGLLARIYTEPSPFLLGPEEAFRRIPLGYLTFLILTVALYWLLRRLGIRDVRGGLAVGGIFGAVLWGALALGLYSISTAPVALLVGWWSGQAAELALAGAVLGLALAGARPRRLWLWALGVALSCVAAVVALQSLGMAPAMRTVGQAA
jgi:hypothetical protein